MYGGRKFKRNYNSRTRRKKLEVLAEVEDLDIIDWLYNNGYEYEASILLKRNMFHATLADFYHIF